MEKHVYRVRTTSTLYGDARRILLALADVADDRGVVLTNNTALRNVRLSNQRIDAVSRAIRAAEQSGDLLILNGFGQDRFFVIATGMNNAEIAEAVREIQLWKIQSGIMCPVMTPQEWVVA